MKTPFVIAIAVGSFFIGTATTYFLLHEDYAELHTKESLCLVDSQSKNQIILPAGTVLVRGGHIPWAPDDSSTAFLPLFIPDKQVKVVHPTMVTGKTYYGISTSQVANSPK